MSRLKFLWHWFNYGEQVREIAEMTARARINEEKPTANPIVSKRITTKWALEEQRLGQKPHIYIRLIK